MPEPKASEALDILILGGAGQVGTELQAPALWDAGTRLHAPSRTALDVTDAAAIDAAKRRGRCHAFILIFALGQTLLYTG